ncbi:hypothetical protein [Kineococcus indalonis]|uniref:hypothetical protein n=1 Tax=Kineococcus indalonis TaxID=2696566 RepID=UPI001412BF9F|nr:hypothetical protein [Kineococcus indalonis]NAZ84955.1 hypothetical protein [Kineococcus indalonis]
MDAAAGSEQDRPADGPPATGDEDRRGPDRRKLIDLTRAERGEPERRRFVGVDRRSPGPQTPVPELEDDQDVPPRPEEDAADAGEDRR